MTITTTGQIIAPAPAAKLYEVRCKNQACKKLLARNLTGSIEIVCSRCQTFNSVRAV